MNKRGKDMPKILVNYTYNKKTDKYSLMNSNVVYADMPVATMELGTEFEEPLIVNINNKALVVEKEEYLSVNKEFKLVVNEDGSVEEHENGTPIWLPKNTEIARLRYIDGQLVLIEKENTIESEENK